MPDDAQPSAASQEEEVRREAENQANVSPAEPPTTSPRTTANADATGKPRGVHPSPANEGHQTTAQPRPSGTLRTTAEARRTSDLSFVPDGFPQGPILGTRKEMKVIVLAFCSNHNTGSGGFGVHLARQAAIAKSRGDRAKLACTKAVLGKNDTIAACKFYVQYEECLEGWVLVTYHPHNSELEHSHDLYQTQVEMMARASGHSLPPELLNIAHCMAKTNSIANIDKTLQANAREMGLPMTWTRDYLRNHFAPSHQVKGLQVANLLADLESRKSDTGLKYLLQTDDDDVIDRVFVELKGGFDTWARGSPDNVLLFDPTWGTNKQGYKLCCFTTVGSTGQTEVVAFVLLKSESLLMFEWAFRSFASVFKVGPASIFTDGDANLATAITMMASTDINSQDGLEKAPWLGVRHLLCVYHLSQNFFTHIKPIFGADIEGWKKALNMFWKIAKDTDSIDKERCFHDAWEQLVSLINELPDSPGKMRELEWLEELRTKRRMFCASFVWEACTWGIHSTQRAESMQSSIKKYIHGRMNIIDLIPSIDSFNEYSRERKLLQQHILHLQQQSATGNCALVDFLQDKITPHALKLVLEQQHLSLTYDATLASQVDEDSSLSGVDEFTIWHVSVRKGMAAVKQTQSPPIVNSDGSISWEKFTSPEDFGQSEAMFPNGLPRPRTTSLLECSCQFTMAFGGLPCRHIIYLHTINATKVEMHARILNNIKSKWVFLGQATCQRLVKDLRMVEDPTKSIRYTRTLKIDRVLRFRVLSRHFEALCNVATDTDEHFDDAVAAMEALTLKLSADPIPRRDPPPDDGRWCAAGRPTVSAETPFPGEPTPQNTDRPLRESPTDLASLSQVLGINFKPRLPPSLEAMSEEKWQRQLLGKPIALKFKPLKHGGWYLGFVMKVRISSSELLEHDENHFVGEKEPQVPAARLPDAVADAVSDSSEAQEQNVVEVVEAQKPDEKTQEELNAEYLEQGLEIEQVLLAFPADKTYFIDYLQPGRYSVSPTAVKYSWCLLDEVPLGVSPDATTKDPKSTLKNGRPRTIRHAPAAGPLGKRQKTSHKKRKGNTKA